jgi:hypothetical protein
MQVQSTGILKQIETIDVMIYSTYSTNKQATSVQCNIDTSKSFNHPVGVLPVGVVRQHKLLHKLGKLVSFYTLLHSSHQSHLYIHVNVNTLDIQSSLLPVVIISC